MAERSKKILEVETFDLTADKGYFNEEQIRYFEHRLFQIALK